MRAARGDGLDRGRERRHDRGDDDRGDVGQDPAVEGRGARRAGAPASSAVAALGVPARRVARIEPPSTAPSVTLVLPMSIARSMGGSYGRPERRGDVPRPGGRMPRRPRLRTSPSRNLPPSVTIDALSGRPGKAARRAAHPPLEPWRWSPPWRAIRPRSSSSTGPRDQPDRHPAPPPPDPQADRLVPVPPGPGAWSRTGRAGWSAIVVDEPDVSTYFTPIAITINVDSFEHLEFETRPDQLLVYTLVQGDERVVIEFVPGVADEDEGPVGAAPARARHGRVRPDGAARPGGGRGVAPGGGRARHRGTDPGAGEGAGNHLREDRQNPMSAASPAAPKSGNAIADYFKFAERGTTLGHRGPGRPDHVHGHGLHHLPEPEHPDGRVQGRGPGLHGGRARRRHRADRRAS